MMNGKDANDNIKEPYGSGGMHGIPTADRIYSKFYIVNGIKKTPGVHQPDRKTIPFRSKQTDISGSHVP